MYVYVDIEHIDIVDHTAVLENLMKRPKHF